MNLSGNPEGQCELHRSMRLLRNVPFFSELHPELIRVLAYLCEHQVFLADQEIFRAGDPADTAVILVRGSARILHGERPVATVEQGACVGGLSLLGQFHWLYSLRAAVEVECLLLPRHKFQPQFLARPEALMALTRGLVGSVIAWEQRQLDQPRESATTVLGLL